jgi:hypothetical protein
MSINGTNCVNILDISNADSFMNAQEFTILPTMNPFPGPKFVLVVDNAAVHNRVPIYIMCARFGVILIFLSVYSFDFNPIELLFNVTKKKWKAWVVILTIVYYPNIFVIIYGTRAVTAEVACNML